MVAQGRGRESEIGLLQIQEVVEEESESLVRILEVAGEGWILTPAAHEHMECTVRSVGSVGS